MTSWETVPIPALDHYLWTSVSERLASTSPWGLDEPRSNSAGVGKSQKCAFLTSFQAMLILLPQALRVTAWDYVSNCVDKRKIKVILFKPLLFHSPYPQLTLPKWSGGKTSKSRLAWLDLMGGETPSPSWRPSLPPRAFSWPCSCRLPCRPPSNHLTNISWV